MATFEISQALLAAATKRRRVARKAELLVDISIFTRSASMSIEVDVTSQAWDACGAPERSLAWPGSDDLALDLLKAVRAAAARSGEAGMHKNSLDFVYLVDDGVVAMTFTVGPGDDGEPIGTITLRGEAWPPGSTIA